MPIFLDSSNDDDDNDDDGDDDGADEAKPVKGMVKTCPLCSSVHPRTSVQHQHISAPLLVLIIMIDYCVNRAQRVVMNMTKRVLLMAICWLLMIV